MEENLGKKSETMDVSWRSVPAVLDFVNGIFENVSAGLSGFNSDSMEEWKRIWKTHESAEKLASLPGVSRLYMVKPIYNSFGNEDYSETVYPLVVELLKEVQPWRHGWECHPRFQERSYCHGCGCIAVCESRPLEMPLWPDFG